MQQKAIEAKKAQAWPLLTNLAAGQGLITYGQIAKDVGLGKDYARSARHFLHPIQAFCEAAGFPPLTALVTNRKGERGQGYHRDTLLTEQEQVANVRAFDWRSIPNPFEKTALGLALEDDLVNAILTRQQAEDQFAKIPQRGYRQAIFRKALLKAYGRRCAVCEIRLPEMLEAAHIKPWALATTSERISVNNGLLLCRNHHVTFDLGLWWYGDGGIRNSERLVKNNVQTLYTHALRKPKNKEWWPDEQLLVWHREHVAGQHK